MSMRNILEQGYTQKDVSLGEQGIRACHFDQRSEEFPICHFDERSEEKS
ncbi:MAG: hypothetical protein ACK44E_09750 [Anaerolineales bacterium]